MGGGAVFSLRVLPRQLGVSGDDKVSAVAAAGDVVWVGTEAGRLLRYDVTADAVAEMRNRMGVGRFASPVRKIFADPYSRGALVILRNADAHYAASSGELRPRFIAQLRGMWCTSAAWVRLPQAALRPGGGGGGFDVFGARPAEDEYAVVALLGTKYGSVFLLTQDVKNERDSVRKMWSAPSGERIDGIRVERVAGCLVGTIATPSSLYSLYGATTLAELFSSQEGDAVHRLGDAEHPADAKARAPRAAAFEAPLPSELQFLSSMASGGVASRRFVWAAQAGILHAQLALRSRRAPAGEEGAAEASITASVTEKAAVSWGMLKETSGSSVPMACNLSMYHTLVLYPGSVFAYNQISGELTEVLDLWRPRPRSAAAGAAGASPLAGSFVAPPGEDGVFGETLLASPAAGFARDVLIDALWVFTYEGQLARVETGSEEQAVAWRAAKAVGRFDLAMALAPFVGSPLSDDMDFTQSREAVLEAQADHAASNGDWEAAARLYAKTNRPIEAVIVDIVDACARNQSDESGVARTAVVSEVRRGKATGGKGPGPAGANGGTVALGKKKKGAGGEFQPGAALPRSRQGVGNVSSEAAKLIIVYLVCKLDTIPESQPSQRTIVATVLVQLYASCLSRLSITSGSSTGEQAELREDFRNFIADNHKDLHVPTAVSVLASHRCYDFAQLVCVQTGEYSRAAEVCLLHADVDDALSLVSDPVVSSKPAVVADVLSSLTPTMATRAPRRLAKAWAAAARNDNPNLDHKLLLTALARVARAPSDVHSGAAYLAATDYICHVLCGVVDTSNAPLQAALRRSSMTNMHVESEGPLPSGCVPPLSPEWHMGVRLLFALHADCGVSSNEAEQSYDAVVREYEHDKSDETRDTLRDLLMSGHRGKFWGLLARVYGALGQHQEAVSIALDHGENGDSSAAEVHVLGAERSLPKHTVRELWTQIADFSTDPLGVSQRSNGMLRVDDALPLMQDFSRAEPRVIRAVTDSLIEHQAAASAAADDAKHTLGRTAAIRSDISSATAWREQHTGAPCGHGFSALRAPPVPKVVGLGGMSASGRPGAAADRGPECQGAECPWCGPGAIESLDEPML